MKELAFELEAASSDTDVTVYWEKPERPSGSYTYRIFCDDREAGGTDRTHFRLTGLEPGSVHTVRVHVLREQEFLPMERPLEQGMKTTFKYQSLQPWAVSAPLTVSLKPVRPRLDVTKAPYLASGDGKTLNTAAIQRAIDDCGPGGSVYIPAGVFLTGALHLHSDMELYLDEGAVLQGTAEPEDYLPRIWSRFEGIEMECYSSLLNLGWLEHPAEKPGTAGAVPSYVCENVVIRGRGTIASGGRVLAERIISRETERLKDRLQAMGDKIREYEKPETIPGRVRPRLINMSRCRGVVLDGLTLRDGASWNVHMIYSDRIVTHDCKFHSKDVWNGDGWDPDSSTNCTIFGCVFDTGDDSIAIKSGKNPEGNRIGRPTRHVRIFDCVSRGGHGITLGSEISGGIEDVSIWDCDMGRSLCGLEIKGTKKRGGYVRNVRVRDCRTPRVMIHSVGYNDDGEPAPAPPVFSDCTFENVEITCRLVNRDGSQEPCQAILVDGFDVPGYEAKNIVFRNICLGDAQTDGERLIALRRCAGVTLEGLSCL